MQGISYSCDLLGMRMREDAALSVALTERRPFHFKNKGNNQPLEWDELRKHQAIAMLNSITSVNQTAVTANVEKPIMFSLYDAMDRYNYNDRLFSTVYVHTSEECLFEIRFMNQTPRNLETSKDWYLDLKKFTTHIGRQ